MLRQVLGVTPAELTMDVIQSLIENRIPEGQFLDYKQQPPNSKAFSKAVAAMANGGGGIIVVGLKDDGSLPTEITPIRVEADGNQPPEASRLQQVFAQNIQPLPTLQFHAVKHKPDDTDGVLVIEVLPSDLTPFAVSEDPGQFSYAIRSGEHRHPLSEAQVSQMYRDRFRALAGIEEYYRRLRSEADAYLDGTPAIHGYVIAIPTQPGNRRLFRPTRAETNRIAALRNADQRGDIDGSAFALLNDRLHPIFHVSSEGRIIPAHVRPGFRSMVFTHSPIDSTNYPKQPRVELHDDGAFLGTFRPSSGDTSDEFGRITSVQYTDASFTVQILARLAAIWAFSVIYGITGDALIRIGLTGLSREVTGTMEVAGHLRSPLYDTCVLKRPVESEARIDVGDLMPGPALLRTAKPLLDDLFSAFCWPECLFISAEGALRRKYIDRNAMASYFGPWAKAVGVGWTDELVT